MMKPLGVSAIDPTSVRLGFLGLGWWGTELAEAARRSGAGRVDVGFSPSSTRRRAFAERFGCAEAASLDEFFDRYQPEGVVIATPHSTHPELIERAVAAGCDVFVDKPLATSAQAAQRSVTVAAAHGVTLMVGHQRRRAAANRALKRMIENGMLGEVLMAECAFCVPGGYPARWREDSSESPLGAMTGLGVHMVDTMQYLVGPVHRVAAVSRRVSGPDGLDRATALLLEFSKGETGTLVASHFVPDVCQVTLYGTQAWARSERDGQRLVLQCSDDTGPVEVPLTDTDPLVEQLLEFTNCIRTGAPVETDGFVGLSVAEVLDAAVASAQTDRFVEVDRTTATRSTPSTQFTFTSSKEQHHQEGFA